MLKIKEYFKSEGRLKSEREEIQKEIDSIEQKDIMKNFKSYIFDQRESDMSALERSFVLNLKKKENLRTLFKELSESRLWSMPKELIIEKYTATLLDGAYGYLNNQEAVFDLYDDHYCEHIKKYMLRILEETREDDYK